MAYQVKDEPKNKFLDLSKLKAFTDDSCHLKTEIALGRVKTLWEKEKMLVTSIFSFSHCGFKMLLFHNHLQSGLCCKCLMRLQDGIDFCTDPHDRSEMVLKSKLYTISYHEGGRH